MKSQSKFNNKYFIIIAVIVAFLLSLLLFDLRILVNETKIKNPKGQDYIICKYFTGRSFVDQEMWYAANNFLGVDSCPFIRKR